MPVSSTKSSRTGSWIKHHQRQAGFTLIELMASLAVFALFSAMAYQSLVDVWRSQNALTQRSSNQEKRALAYRTLSQLLTSGAKITGTQSKVILDFSGLDTPFSSQTPSTQLLVSRNVLSVVGPNQVELMHQIESPSFSFIDNSERTSAWTENRAPDLIELNWQSNSTAHRWLFRIQ